MFNVARRRVMQPRILVNLLYKIFSLKPDAQKSEAMGDGIKRPSDAVAGVQHTI
jgi:hypothetical protein